MWHYCSMRQSTTKIVCGPSQLETVNRGTYLHLTDNGVWDHGYDITKP